MAYKMTEHDTQLLANIMDERDPMTIAQLIHRYYGDMDRAERTPREVMYLHLGMMSGLIERLATLQ